MSKVKNIDKDINKDMKKVDPKEAIETLRVQLQDHISQADHHKTMAVKAQGALEVLLQMYPEKDKNES